MSGLFITLEGAGKSTNRQYLAALWRDGRIGEVWSALDKAVIEAPPSCRV